MVTIMGPANWSLIAVAPLGAIFIDQGGWGVEKIRCTSRPPWVPVQEFTIVAPDAGGLMPDGPLGPANSFWGQRRGMCGPM